MELFSDLIFLLPTELGAHSPRAAGVTTAPVSRLHFQPPREQRATFTQSPGTRRSFYKIPFFFNLEEKIHYNAENKRQFVSLKDWEFWDQE